MTNDVETLFHYARIALWVAAFFTTLFPILYAFSGWWTYLLGRILMLQTLGLAAAIDFTLLLTYWQPEGMVGVLRLDIAVFSIIALSSALMCWKMWSLNHRNRKKRKEPKDVTNLQ